MQLNLEKRPAGSPKSGENPEIVNDVALRERFPACSALGGWYNERALRAPAPSPDHNARPQWMTILKMSSGIRSTYGRSPSLFEPLYPYYCHYQGPYRVAVVLGRGKPAKIEVALSNWLIELGGYQVKLLGEQLRKDGASRPRDRRGQVRFPPLRVSDQAADVAVGIDEVRAGDRALKAETAKS
jgi:hypothetical protein